MGLDIFFKKRVERELGYFRKVNFLVKYFTDLGFDVEHQIPFEITIEDIEVLLKRCKQVLKDHKLAPTLLPTMEGFFFGNTDYDEYYYQDIKEVRNFIEKDLIPEMKKLKDNESIYFETWY